MDQNIPWIGYGTYHDRENRPAGWWEEVYQAALEAVLDGYRLIDTASGYLNEEEVGQAVRDSRAPRDKLYITSKMRISEQGYDETLRAFDRSMEKLKLSSLDLYMVHWPVPGKFGESYRAMERLKEEGAVRCLGISNFEIRHFETLQKTASVPPDVVQLEIHPYLSQKELVRYYKGCGMAVEAWSPFGRGEALRGEDIREIARHHGKTPAQVILRWHVQNGVIPLPKSSGRHIRENLEIGDFSLSEKEMETIDGMNRDWRCMEYPGILAGEYGTA